VSGLPHVKAGRARALAVTSRTRSPMLPDVPALAESGMPEIDARNWFGVVVPKGTPKAIVDRLSRVIMEYMRLPETKARVQQTGAEAVGSTPAEFAELIRRESERWAKVVEQAGMKVD
jgi:tripartite-type tricarboxylate transporter receptor subunit TctC